MAGAALFVSGGLLTAGVGHTYAEFSDFQVVHAEAQAGVWGPNCLAKGEKPPKPPKGAPKPPPLPRCPISPPPPGTCQEDVASSVSPDSSADTPLGSLPQTLSVVYRDETPLNTTDNPPTLEIDGAAQPPSALIVLSTSAKNNEETVSYSVPGSYADGTLHTFVITVYDGDPTHSDGCGVGTFYVKVPTP